MSFNFKKIILSFLLLIVNTTSVLSQKNDFNAVLLSRESDYEYRYRPRSREQILIDFEDSLIYYRKRSNQKFKLSKLPYNNFFKDSINYQELDDLIAGMANETDLNCDFGNYGSMRITIIYGSSNQNYSESFEFGNVISCKDEKDFWILKRIQQEHLKMRNQIF